MVKHYHSDLVNFTALIAVRIAVLIAFQFTFLITAPPASSAITNSGCMTGFDAGYLSGIDTNCPAGFDIGHPTRYDNGYLVGNDTGYESDSETSNPAVYDAEPEARFSTGTQNPAFDTLFSGEITPGAVHTRYLADGPNILDVIAVDLSAPWLHFETYKPDELTKTTDQSLSVDSPGYRVVAAINGDFFSFETHQPIANQMVRGRFAHGAPAHERYHFSVDADGRPYIEALSFEGLLTLPDKSSHRVTGINYHHDHTGILAFNHYAGRRTPPGEDVLEYTLHPVDPSESAGSGVARSMRVAGAHSSGGNAIPDDGYIIRIQGAEKTESFANKISEGDMVSFQAGFDSGRIGLTDVMGGGVRILDQGEPYSGANEARHPRTFVAIDRDTTTVFLCTVDGRQAASIGMTYREMASFLLKIGAWDAVNLDGGGSTTMVIRNKVANTPSDPGGERRVANSLLLVSTAPAGKPDKLQLTPSGFDLYPHETGWLVAGAFDEFRNPVPIPDNLQWHADPSLGTLHFRSRQTGDASYYRSSSAPGTDIGFQIPGQAAVTPGSYATLIPGNSDTSGFVTVRYGDLAESTKVRIHHFNTMTAEPGSLDLAPGEKQKISLYGITADGSRRSIPLDRVLIDKPGNLLHLSGTGVAYARSHGEGSISMNIGSANLDVPFAVRGEIVQKVLYDFSDGIGGWATPAQTHRSQILGVLSGESTLRHTDDTGTWVFYDEILSAKDADGVNDTDDISEPGGINDLNSVNDTDGISDPGGISDPVDGNDWDIRITRHLRQELGDLIAGDYAAALVWSDSALDVQLVIRDGDGQLEAGPSVTLTPGNWQLIQAQLHDTNFEGYLNGNGELTPEGNQVNGFRIRMERNEIRQQSATFKVRKILSSPSPISIP